MLLYERIFGKLDSTNMKIIAIPDIHGRVDKMKPYVNEIKAADVVILAGDLTNGSLETAKIVLDAFHQYNNNILTIPGNMDTEEIVAFTGEQGYNIHRTHQVINDIVFVGMGGALPFAGPYVYTEQQYQEMLSELGDTVPDLPQVFVCHQPPINTINDRLYDGRQVGSPAVRDYIETYQPLVCFTGHIHEAIGVDTIGNTHICNPGPVWKGYACLEIIDGAVASLDIQSVAE